MRSEATPLHALKAATVALAFSTLAVAPPLAWAWRQGIFDPPLLRLARALGANDAAMLDAARAALRTETPVLTFAAWLQANPPRPHEGHAPVLLHTGNLTLTTYPPERTARRWSGTELSDASGATLTLLPPNAAQAWHPPPFSAFLPLIDLF